MAALARHVCLAAPDKAEFRTAAIKGATDLITDLPQHEQDAFVGFTYSLSRSSKVRLGGRPVALVHWLYQSPACRPAWLNLCRQMAGCAVCAVLRCTVASTTPLHHDYFLLYHEAYMSKSNHLPPQCCQRLTCNTSVSACLSQTAHRTLAVGLSQSLLMHLPEPFKHSTFTTPAPTLPANTTANSTTPAAAAPGLVPAPWSAVCLAVLLQRCGDKVAGVRARALADMAAVVECFGELLAQDPGSEQYSVAESFVLGLAAAEGLQVGCMGRM